MNSAIFYNFSYKFYLLYSGLTMSSYNCMDKDVEKVIEDVSIVECMYVYVLDHVSMHLIYVSKFLTSSSFVKGLRVV